MAVRLCQSAGLTYVPAVNIVGAGRGDLGGGKLAGRQTDLTEATLFQKRDMPLLNDYRSVLSHVLSRMYGLDRARLDKVFPGSSLVDYGIV